MSHNKKSNLDVHANLLYARGHKKGRMARVAPIPSFAQATGKRGGHHARVTKELRRLGIG